MANMPQLKRNETQPKGIIMADEKKEIIFNANISSIVKFEKQTGKSMMKAFSDDEMSITTIVQLAKCLSNADDEMLDEYIKEHGFEGLADGITEALKNSGFLPKDKLPTAE